MQGKYIHPCRTAILREISLTDHTIGQVIAVFHEIAYLLVGILLECLHLSEGGKKRSHDTRTHPPSCTCMTCLYGKVFPLCHLRGGIHFTDGTVFETERAVKVILIFLTGDGPVFLH